MADSVDGDHFGSTSTSFSQLLFSEEDIAHHHSHFFSSSLKAPKMLCFGDYYHFQQNTEKDVDNKIYSNDVNSTTATPQKYGVTCSDSSSASSATATTIISAVKSNKNASTISKSNRKRSGSEEPMPKIESSSTNQRIGKKSKMENPISTGHPKARREKLGERVSALQQLVSPFGKTDTASVLHEAMGYIKFLQDQVQVLCSPYLQEGEEHGKGTAAKKDLRSRGLCLVPVDSTVHVAGSNGADYWSPAVSKH